MLAHTLHLDTSCHAKIAPSEYRHVRQKQSARSGWIVHTRFRPKTYLHPPLSSGRVRSRKRSTRLSADSRRKLEMARVTGDDIPENQCMRTHNTTVEYDRIS